MPLHQNLPKNTAEKRDDGSSNCCELAKASFSERVRRSHESDRTGKRNSDVVDQIGPHIELLKKLGGVSDSYSPVPAGQPRTVHEKNIRDTEERMQNRLEKRGCASDLPKDAHVIDLSEVLAAQRSEHRITNFKEFLDRAGVIPGETSYLTFPDGSVSAVRRRVLDNTTAANEVLWVENFAAVGHLYNLEFFDEGACLIEPVPYDIRGFFSPDSRIAVMPMIDKRNDRPLSEWRSESLAMLQVAVHELEHGRGGGEYQARAAADMYLYRNGVIPTPGDPERRVKSMCFGRYSSAEYSAAAGEAMRELEVSSLIIPSRTPNPRFDSSCVPIVASASIGAFESRDAMEAGHGADLTTYGLVEEGNRLNGRMLLVREEGTSGDLYRWVGEPLSDCIMRETLRPENGTLRTLVGEALSHRVAYEAIRMAKIFNAKNLTSVAMRNIADDIAATFEPGDVHLALRDYVSFRGGAGVIPDGKEVSWINALPEGVAIRMDDGITIYLASPRHRGAALRIPITEGDSYEDIAERVRAFDRNVARLDALHARRSGRALWESVAVQDIGRGARYLFAASDAGKASQTESLKQ